MSDLNASPERLWLEPSCHEPGERCWSAHPLDDCCEEGCGLPSVEYVRADIAQAKTARLTTQLAEAREALAPFARHAEKYEHAIYPDSHGILGPMVEPSIKAGDFRRAARALRALTSPAQPGAETMETPDDPARIYLMCQRKAWHFATPIGWSEVAWERFDFVECGIFEKPKADLTDEDRGQWLQYYSKRPEGWIEPAPKPAPEGPGMESEGR